MESDNCNYNNITSLIKKMIYYPSKFINLLENTDVCEYYDELFVHAERLK